MLKVMGGAAVLRDLTLLRLSCAACLLVKLLTIGTIDALVNSWQLTYPRGKWMSHVALASYNWRMGFPAQTTSSFLEFM